MFGSTATNGAVNVEQKVKEQAEQILKLREMGMALKNENAALKASPGSPAHVLELNKKEELIVRLKQEAKKVIDQLKSKHAEEMTCY